MFQFTVLGSGTAHAHPERGPAGFLVRTAHGAWLVDGGSGTLQRLARLGVDPGDLSGGIYSHRHPDHTGDLVPLLFHQCVTGRSSPYPIYAGEGFGAFLEGLRGVYGRSITSASTVPVIEMPLTGPGQADLGHGLTLRTMPANHSGGALHLRFDYGGRSVVFSGDTGPSANLVTLSMNVDLLVCECAHSDEAATARHLSPGAIESLARRAAPHSIWLTHFYPDVDASKALATIGRSGVECRRADDLDTWTAT